MLHIVFLNLKLYFVVFQFGKFSSYSKWRQIEATPYNNMLEILDQI